MEDTFQKAADLQQRPHEHKCIEHKRIHVTNLQSKDTSRNRLHVRANLNSAQAVFTCIY